MPPVAPAFLSSPASDSKLAGERSIDEAIALFNASPMAYHSVTCFSPSGSPLKVTIDGGAPITCIAERVMREQYPEAVRRPASALRHRFAGLGGTRLGSSVAVVPIVFDPGEEAVQVFCLIVDHGLGCDVLLGNHTIATSGFRFGMEGVNGVIASFLATPSGYILAASVSPSVSPVMVVKFNYVISPGESCIIPLCWNGTRRASGLGPSAFFTALPEAVQPLLIHDAYKCFDGGSGDTWACVVSNPTKEAFEIVLGSVVFRFTEWLSSDDVACVMRIESQEEEMAAIRRRAEESLDWRPAARRAKAVFARLRADLAAAAASPDPPPSPPKPPPAPTELFSAFSDPARHIPLDQGPTPPELEFLEAGADFPIPSASPLPPPSDVDDYHMVLSQAPFKWRAQTGELLLEAKPLLARKMIALILVMRDKKIFFKEGDPLRAVKGFKLHLEAKPGARPFCDQS